MWVADDIFAHCAADAIQMLNLKSFSELIAASQQRGPWFLPRKQYSHSSLTSWQDGKMAGRPLRFADGEVQSSNLVSTARHCIPSDGKQVAVADPEGKLYFI